MMLQQGVPPGLLGNSNSGDAAAVAQQAAAARESSGGGGGELLGGGSFSEEERGRMEEGERNNSGGGNRWPRQETLALLKIRSDMDVAFRDSSLKGPLWDEVSRKLAELGYHRSAKKCKEKFENVYKYHKRTKEGRTSKADGKTYRFFDQLEALDTHPPPTPTPIASHHPLSLPAPPPLPQPKPLPVVAPKTTVAAAAMPIVSQVGTVPSVNAMVTVSLSNVNPISMAPAATAQVPAPISQPAMNVNHHQRSTVHFGHQNVSGSILSNSTSSSTSSDEEPPERSRKRKRKWKDFFGRLMKEVIDKQEELQMKFLDTLEKRERERTIREEAWRVQEMAKMNREHDLLVQERSIAAAKDAAVISFLQKITEQQTAQNPNAATPQLPIQIQVQESPQPAPPPAPSPVLQQQPPAPPAVPAAQSQPLAAVSLPIPVPAPVPIPVSAPPAAIMSTPPPIPSMKNMIIVKTDNGGSGDNNMLSPSPSRWPKAEVQALIKLRTTLDMKYQENGPKGPLWEEISSSMRKLGYNRNAKRCKEKWENINKYYKKVKESSKKRPEDSKTCPYFHQLDAIYRDKAKTEGPFNNSAGFAIKPENQMAPIMARPEQQWPLAPLQDQQQQQQRIDHQSAMDVDHESENHDEDDEDDDEEDEDEDEGAGYEIVTNKASSMASVE